MTDTVSYTAADLIDGQGVPAKKGHILRWLREQPMAARSEFILAVCDLDLLVGLELSKKVELRGPELRRVLARGLDLDVSSIRDWLHYCRTLLGSDGLLSFLEELVEIEPERVARTGYWLRFSFRGGLDRYHRVSLDALYRRCDEAMTANAPVASAIDGFDVEQAIAILKTRLLGRMLNDSTNSDRAIVRQYDLDHNQCDDLQL